MKKRFLTVFLSVAMCLLSAFSMIGCKDKTFTVTFDPDGGELVSGELVQVVESASDIVEPELKKEGYTLKGWDTVLAEIDSDTTVKALWDKAKFTVKFVVNEGQHVEGSGELTQAVTSGEELVEPKFVREGYTLTWDTDLKTITSACVVKGVWNPNKYVLSFQDNNGNPIVGIDDMEVTYDSPLGVLPKHSSTEYKFAGWANKADKDQRLTTGEVWKYAHDLIAVPLWTALNNYTIEYDLNGGSALNNPLAYKENTAVIISDPTRVGYTFIGWTEYEVVDGEKGEIKGEVAGAGKALTIPAGTNEDKYYKAEWQANTYQVTFNITQGKFTENNAQQITIPVTYDQYIDFPEITVGTGEREPFAWTCTIGEKTYTFTGDEKWTIDQNDCVFNASYTYVFKITLNLTCTVRGRTVTSTIPAGSATTYTFKEGDTITGLPTATPEDTEEYTFTDWKYYEGNNTSGPLKVIKNVSALQPTFVGFPVNNGVIEITVYACCRANWTPAY